MFSNSVKVEWIEHEPRKMRLIESVIFTDGNQRDWIAPVGAIIDGASIPRWLWPVIGSPFVGRYRRASVMHDVFCVEKTHPSADVHRMFAAAMACDGVPHWKHKLIYQTVRVFGPQW